VGTQAPSLRALPILGVPRSAQGLQTDERPKLLAVQDLTRVYVGITEYRLPTGAQLPNPELFINPSRATEHSLGLPFNQPRAYPSNDEHALEYEGSVSGELSSGFLRRGADGLFTLADFSALFCNTGVSDVELSEELGRERFGLAPEAEKEASDARPSLERFALGHSDHIVITADFPEEDDAYWPGSVYAVAGDPASGTLECSRQQCELAFGELPEKLDIPELPEARQFTIRDAEQQRLVLEPRHYDERKRDLEALACSTPQCEESRAAQLAELEATRDERRWMAECCFPSAVTYQVRASSHWTLVSSIHGFRHDVIPVAEVEADGRAVVECRRDCDPRKRDMHARVFEIAQQGCSPRDGLPCQANPCITPETVNGTSLGSTWRAVRLDEPAWACVHQTSTSHFALYQGLTASRRGMAFGWQVIGGFNPLTVSLGQISTYVAPQAIVPLPHLDRVSVVDSASLGLALIGLDGLRVLLPTLN
jgi:hypothetical protein